MTEAKVRLFVDQSLASGQPVALAEAQANYLFNVMRLAPGDAVLLFNGRDGEWRATVADAGKRRGVLLCEAMTRPLRLPPDLWLLFAPIRKERTQFIVEKAVELGVARLLPVQTRRTQTERIRQDRMQAHAMEAAEQCGATFVPEVAALTALDKVLADWPPDRHLLWCDEALAGQPAGLPGARGLPWAILIGPEGGFSPEEQQRLRALPQVTPLSLGPRILRADTAAVAALTLWQAALGDWT
jgi:16S rRNA (uracil1498-N3)-methyltransferase